LAFEQFSGLTIACSDIFSGGIAPLALAFTLAAGKWQILMHGFLLTNCFNQWWSS